MIDNKNTQNKLRNTENHEQLIGPECRFDNEVLQKRAYVSFNQNTVRNKN